MVNWSKIPFVEAVDRDSVQQVVGKKDMETQLMS